MAKKLTKKTQQPTPEPEKPLEETAAEHTDANTDDSNTDTADSNTDDLNTDADDSNSDAETEAVVTQNRCPKCQHVSSEKATKLGGVNRAQCYIEIEGTAFHRVESQRIMCERCKQIHFVKTYR